MNIALVTGSGGLIGSQAAKYFSQKMDKVIGVDNDSRSYFFGEGASTKSSIRTLQNELSNFENQFADIRDFDHITKIFNEYGSDIKLVVHTAAQPSHDWAAKEPFTDFTINANGTLNLLEATRLYCPEAVFIFTSTNKVYGDTPNFLPLEELETRWEVAKSHPYFEYGIDENMSIDHCKHSLFGASKVAADVLVQEYGRYFGINTGVFRGGCLTGPNHASAELHGFLSYLMKCCITGKEYTIFGYQGKQVRDNIHSFDLITMFDEFYQKPRSGEVYNAGGGRFSNCSMQEAIRICQQITGKKMRCQYFNDNRIGDHIWYISDTNKFKDHYPNWTQTKDVMDILGEIFETSK
ncbi:NAD-dependent epimerase/dehydratase family protein [Akkermansiaceae bacterium]|nr:NAD-dependent epimerase/dehydratase family protein [Akkermansiaceae bacterium]